MILNLMFVQLVDVKWRMLNIRMIVIVIYIYFCLVIGCCEKSLLSQLMDVVKLMISRQLMRIGSMQNISMFVVLFGLLICVVSGVNVRESVWQSMKYMMMRIKVCYYLFFFQKCFQVCLVWDVVMVIFEVRDMFLVSVMYWVCCVYWCVFSVFCVFCCCVELVGVVVGLGQDVWCVMCCGSVVLY